MTVASVDDDLPKDKISKQKEVTVPTGIFDLLPKTTCNKEMVTVASVDVDLPKNEISKQKEVTVAIGAVDLLPRTDFNEELVKVQPTKRVPSDVGDIQQD